MPRHNELKKTGDSSSRYPKRNRLTPEQAREKRRAEQQKEREARRAEAHRRARLAQRIQQEILARPPTVDLTLHELDNMANNIHNAYNWDGRSDQCVTAVVKMRNGQHLICAQRYMHVMLEYAQRHYPREQFDHVGSCDTHHMHAEMWAIVKIRDLGYDFGNVEYIGVSKEICALCKEKLDEYGIPYTSHYISADARNDWVSPDSLI